MAGLREQRGLDTTVAPDRDKDLPYLPQQPAYTYHPNAPSSSNNVTALPGMKDEDGWVRPHGSAVAHDPEPEDQGQYVGSYDAGETPDYRQQTTSPSAADKIENRMRKLMKRRPVGS